MKYKEYVIALNIREIYPEDLYLISHMKVLWEKKLFRRYQVDQ